MKKLSLFIILTLLFATGTKITKAETETSDNVACTMDAMECPDGSYVGRTGPSCKFAACPGENEKEDKDVPDLLPIQTLKEDSETKREKIKQEMEGEREKTRQELEAKREELKTKMEALRESLKKERSAGKAKDKEDILSGREKALLRFDKIVNSMSDLKDRISAQIESLKAKGVDTEGGEAFVTTAESKLNEVRAKIVEAHSLFSASLNELTVADKNILQNITKSIQTSTNEIRDTLNNAVRSLKDSIISKK